MIGTNELLLIGGLVTGSLIFWKRPGEINKSLRRAVEGLKKGKLVAEKELKAAENITSYDGLDLKRRKFLKFGFFIAIAFVAGGLLGKFGLKEVKESMLNHFVIRESDSELVFYNRKRQRLFTLKNNGDLEIG